MLIPFAFGDALLHNEDVTTTDGYRARIVQAPIWVRVGGRFAPYDYEGHPMARGWSNENDLLIVDEKGGDAMK